MGSVGNKKDLQSSFYHEDRGAADSSPSSDQGSYATYEEGINCSSTALLMDQKTAAPPLHGHTAFHATGIDLGFGHHLSLINFKSNETATTTTDDCFRHDTGAGGSLLSFQQEPPKNNMDPSSAFMWKDDDIGEGNGTNSFGNNNCGYNLRQGMNNDLKSGAIIDDEINTYQPATTSYANWLYSDSTVVTAADRVQETRHQGSPLLLKRPHMGSDDHSMPSSKKQCTAASGSTSANNSKSKHSTNSSNKDPQSLAAKNRRERISERLKVLQELVPNGPKVDLVTMLEKAISYVKFLQLQVKVLATDEFWPAQGGKAPDVSQVKEAIDAILASQRERSSSSK